MILEDGGPLHYSKNVTVLRNILQNKLKHSQKTPDIALSESQGTLMFLSIQK